MDIASADWPRLLRLLDELLALAPAERAGRLDALEGDDGRLRETLRSLIASHHAIEAEGFMATLPRLPIAAPARDRIGPWRLLREIGRGGMSVVHLAERADGVVMAPVALKLPLLDPAGAAAIVERFARERAIVGALDHPGIAAVRDAGVDDGQPWLAIEHVDGRPITEDATARALPVADRLRLFLQVLDAVAHAHAQLVIHRDLKPANVLVDRGGRVKLLDFGIAKLLEAGGAAPASALTQWGARPLTPQYASPEQIAGGALGTPTDIYSLGVLLYELLTAKLPYRLTRTTPGAIEEAILGGGITLPSLAAPPEARRALRGDLDAIVAKALALRPADRYRSAEAFADDIRRHLDSRPIAARPAALLYRAGKQLRRHAFAYASAAALAIALGAGVAATLWQARLARAEAARANAVQRFVLDIFRASSMRQADPRRARETPARELLAIGAARLEQALADSPEARAEVTRALAQMHSDLGLVERAVALRKQAVALAEQLHGPQSLELVAALSDWATDLHHLGQLDERRQALARALAIVRTRADRPSPERADLYRRLSELEQSGDLAEAMRWAERAIADAERLASDSELFASHDVAAMASYLRGDYAGAAPHYQSAIAAAERCRCLFPSELVRVRVQMAEVQNQLLDLKAAEGTLRAALADSVRLNGPQHLDTVQTTLRLGVTLSVNGRPLEALPLLEPLKDIVDGPGGADEFSAPLVFNTLGGAFIQLGRYDDAAAVLRRAIELRDRARANTPFAATLRESLARALVGAGRLDEAAAALEAGERIHRASGAGPGDRRWARLAGSFVTLHLARGETAAALRRAAEMPPLLEGGARPTVAALEGTLVRAQAELDAGVDSDAARRLGAVRQVLDSRGLAADLPLVEARRRLLCGRWALVHAPGQARGHFERSVALRRAQVGGGPVVAEAESWLVRAPADRSLPDSSGPC